MVVDQLDITVPNWHLPARLIFRAGRHWLRPVLYVALVRNGSFEEETFLLQTAPNLAPRPALISPMRRANLPQVNRHLRRSDQNPARDQLPTQPTLMHITNSVQPDPTPPKQLSPQFPRKLLCPKPTVNHFATTTCAPKTQNIFVLLPLPHPTPISNPILPAETP